ncbi:aldose epimerase family protein [Deinococcus sp. QL22]|uniref:aldose epimerase family protein n=1 Tax=Deinococcus sp. QL22 TaxID=2939437 RepID=UPI00201813DB|nr:aldose epimerase family protein [Deinococcus sp. QL22]UQN09690.1 galactose mutarotase [Deinococcus sp. QL22]
MTLTSEPNVTQIPWGQTPAGEPVTLYTLHNAGMQVRIINYGGVIVGVDAPDRDGNLADVTLGHDDLTPYLSRDTSPYFGALIGRYGNRIARGKFELDGRQYALACNNGLNALHGGPGGFDQQLWQAEPTTSSLGASLSLSRVSEDGEEGYPGRLSVSVTYTLTPDQTLRIDYVAQTDQPTIINLTNHTYWNLGGGVRDVLDHLLTVQADTYTPTDETQIPTGELADVTGTPFDLRRPTLLGDALAVPHEQLQRAGGFDHNFVLSTAEDEGVGVGLLDADGVGKLRAVATLQHPASGRCLSVSTTEPGIQVYSGNFLDGSIHGKDGQVYGHRWSVCLETQHFPDSPNQPHFPSTRLEPTQTYQSSTIYAFSVDQPE